MSPGTYNVVVNPDSFQHMPEYSDDTKIKRLRLSPLRRGSLATSMASSWGKDSPIDAHIVSGDPNIIVLPRFEDTVRRATAHWKDQRPSILPGLPGREIKMKEEKDPMKVPQIQQNTEPTLQCEPQHSKYILQFRNVVWKQLVQAELDVAEGNSYTSSSAEVLEQVATDFPPVGALSLRYPPPEQWRAYQILVTDALRSCFMP